MRSLVLLLVFLATLVSQGCWRSAYLMDETAPLGKQPQQVERTTGEACMFSLFGMIPFGEHPVPVAKRRALEATGAQALVDVDVKQDYIFALVGMVLCADVTGVAVMTDPAWQAPKVEAPVLEEPSEDSGGEDVQTW